MPEIYQPYPTSGWPSSVREIKKSQLSSPLFYFLRHHAIHDTVEFRDDFVGKALDTTNVYTTAAGATATIWAYGGTLEDGNIRGVTGTTAATSGLQIQIPNMPFLGSRNYGCEVRWVTSAITEIRVEIGFVNALPAVNTTFVNSLTTPTFNTVTSGILGVFDNASAVNTVGLYGIGSGVTGIRTASSPSILPVAATYQTLRLQVNSTKATMWVNGIMVAQPTADYTTAADANIFAFSVVGSNTTSKNVDIDYIQLWKDRNTASGV